MAKLQDSKGKYWVIIPQLMIKKKGWKKGQEFILNFDQDGNVVIMEV